ncbi:uncharacterized protein LOC116609725 [Nematostella vectensis]|uniref:uncharacterized protein LOC116609725 n=1 Tax=Nematostella vectensis TaxID=45351 RepID=UPI0020771DEC|nr:uncharacterized protein LOC116609725 [Nematostella vectensis]XP_048582103.1 uncharacterized protein LOC116609725 [Nematostella vectensis]
MEAVLAICSSLWEWAKAGLSAAAECFKWVWQSVENLLSGVMDFLKRMFDGACFQFLYRRENTQETCETTTDPVTGAHRQTVETHKDELKIYAGVNDQDFRQQKPSDYSKRRENVIENLENVENFVKGMKEIMIADRQHGNPQVTAGKLQQLMDQPEVQNLQQSFRSIGKVNPVL